MSHSARVTLARPSARVSTSHRPSPAAAQMLKKRSKKGPQTSRVTVPRSQLIARRIRYSRVSPEISPEIHRVLAFMERSSSPLPRTQTTSRPPLM